MMAHVLDGAINSGDIDNVLDMTSAEPAERSAVLRGLSAMGMRVLEEQAAALPDEARADDDPDDHRDISALEADAAARHLLRTDARRRNPSRRVLTALEEIGLAMLMRGSDIPLYSDLPQGYRRELEPSDERARAFDALVVHNMRLVWSIARAQDTGHLELEDVVQHGMLGLWRAVEKFDATKGTKFSTYATWWIRQSITRGIANEGRTIRIPVHIYEVISKVLRTRSRILDQTGVCRLSTLAEETGFPVERVVECLQLAAGVVSLDKPIVEGDGDSLGDFVVSIAADEADPAQLLDRMTSMRLIREALDDLTPREARIISLREGLDGDDPRTLEEIGKEFGLTRERIRQVESKARGKLRVALVKRGIRPLRPFAPGSDGDKAKKGKVNASSSASAKGSLPAE
jgi:RNA polymerase primary sigma factor